MKLKIPHLIAPLILFCIGGAAAQDPEPQPYTFFKNYIHLTDEEVREVQRGTPVTKILETEVENEVAIFGAVWVDADASDFVARQRDIEHFESGDAVVAIKKLSDPPRIEDFAAMRLPEEDLDAIPDCEVGDCEVKLDADTLIALKHDIDWSAPDAHDKASELIRAIALETVSDYLQFGDAGLGARRDKERPVLVEKEFDALLANSPYLLDYIPALRDYLHDYPNAELPGAEDYLYWSMNEFGLRPTLRLSHVVIYRVADDDGRAEYAVASKMLYASHYFHTGLELKFLVKDDVRPNAKGYYLVSLNRSRSDGLTGLFGSVVKNRASAEARDSLGAFLASGKTMLEQGDSR